MRVHLYEVFRGMCGMLPGPPGPIPFQVEPTYDL